MGARLMNEINNDEKVSFSSRLNLDVALREQDLDEVPHFVAVSKFGLQAIFVVTLVHPDRSRWRALAEHHKHMFITSC